MGNLAIYVKMNFNASLGHLENVIPEKKHLKKLENVSPLFDGANTRTIEPDLRDNFLIVGYTICDQSFQNGDEYRKNVPYNKKREMKYFSTDDLDLLED